MSEKQIGKGSFSVVSRSQAGRVIKKINKNLKQSVSSKLKKKYIIQKNILDFLRHNNPDKSNLFSQIYEITPANQSIMKDLGDKNLNWFLKHRFGDLSNDFDNVVQQLFDGVVIMIKSGIFHRDIKPDNIMVRYDNKTGSFQLTFIDFVDALSKNEAVKSKKFLYFGTPMFMPLELLKRNENKDWKHSNPKMPWFEYATNDLWSLGIVLYLLIFNKFPCEMFNELYPNDKISSLLKLYEKLDKDPKLYNSLFPSAMLPEQKKKYLQDVKTLLSFQPNKRSTWFYKKFKQMSSKKTQHSKVSMLLRASEQIGNRKRKLQTEQQNKKATNPQDKISMLLQASELLRNKKKRLQTKY